MRFLKIFVLLCLIGNLYAGEPISMTVNPSQDALQVTLPSNPSTGYQWQVKSYNQDLFTLIGDSYAPVKQSPVIGASGQTTFQFKLVKNVAFPESTVMIFQYLRPWDPNSASQQVVQIQFKSWD